MEKQTGSAYTEVVYDAFGSPIGYHNRSGWDTYFVPLGGRPFVRYQDSKTYFLHPNNLGSTTFVTDETGATIQKTIYYPWGQAWATAGSLKDNRFASLDPRDAETGNDPTLFRLYNPRLYRWLSPDPLAGDVSNPQSLNRYAYVLNNPMNFIDPLGGPPCPANPGPNDPDCIEVTATPDQIPLISKQYVYGCLMSTNPGPQCSYLAGSSNQQTSSTGGGGGIRGGDSTAEKEKQVQQVLDSLLQAVVNDPECLQFLGMKGAKPLSLIRSTPVAVGYSPDPNLGGTSHPTWSPESAIPVANSITVNSNGYGLLYLGSFSFGGQVMKAGSPRALAEVLIHEFAHGANVILHEWENISLEEQNANALAGRCGKAINSFSNAPFVW